MSTDEGDRTLNVAIAAGGTAGHINPALALAEELTSRGHSVTFFGQESKLEGRLVPEAGYPLVPLTMSGFDRSRPWTLVSAVTKLWKAKRDVGRHFLKTEAPDVAVGFGAYVEMPLMSWCRLNGVPYLVHEQNSIPGLANQVCSRHAATVAVSMPCATEAFQRNVGETPIVVTGNPVRKSVIGASRERGRHAYGVGDDETMLLVFGGSLGARHVNEAVARMRENLLAREDLRIVHSTGSELYDEVMDSLSLSDNDEQRWKVVPYIDDMGEALAAADIVVSRAGASSVAEIAALAVPSVLVPYPFATGDHQTANAKQLVDSGAALLVTDSQLDDGALSAALYPLLDDPEELARMRAAARALGQDSAAESLADQVETVATRQAGQDTSVAA